MAGDGSVNSFAVDLGDWFEAHAAEIKANLELYFLGVGGEPFDGRHFETFAAKGDPNAFSATDVLAVEALSVGVPPDSAMKLLYSDAENFNILLRQIPTDMDIWEVSPALLQEGGAALLHERLQKLDGVGWVTAGKLMAAKRPRLIPILDDLVKKMLRPPRNQFWLTMRDQLSDENRRQRIAQVVSCAPDDVSLLRRIDVGLWTHAWIAKRRASGAR